MRILLRALTIVLFLSPALVSAVGCATGSNFHSKSSAGELTVVSDYRAVNGRVHHRISVRAEEATITLELSSPGSTALSSTPIAKVAKIGISTRGRIELELRGTGNVVLVPAEAADRVDLKDLGKSNEIQTVE